MKYLLLFLSITPFTIESKEIVTLKDSGLENQNIEFQSDKQFNIRIKFNEKGELDTSNNIDVNSIKLIEGMDAVLAYEENLLDKLNKTEDLNKKGNATRLLKIMDELEYLNDIKMKMSQKSTNIYEWGDNTYCGINYYLDINFVDYFYSTRMSVSAGSSATGPYPPFTPSQELASIAEITTDYGVTNSDYDSFIGNSLFADANALVGSGFASMGVQLPFKAIGTYFIDVDHKIYDCTQFRLIEITGTKAPGYYPIINNIIN